MKKASYSPAQLLLICLLTIFGISLVLSDNKFGWDESGTPCTFVYIHQGEYELTVTCTPVEQTNQITVFSDETVNVEGKVGVTLAQASLEPGQSVISLPLSLEQGIYTVKIKTDLDTDDSSLVTTAHLESNGVLYRDGTFLGGLCLISALALGIIFIKFPREKYLMPLCAVFIGFLAGTPLYADFIIDGHDFNFHLLRIEGIYQAIASGDFPVRLNPLPISGYGYLSSTMYPQLFLYPVSLLRFLNVSLITCYKFFLVMTNVGTALITYYSFKNITKSDKIGILASFLYTFSAYRLVCMYVRTALGEVSAMTFLPLIIWGIYECLWGQRHWFILALGMTGVFQSHILSTEICAMFLLIEFFWWICSRKKQNIAKRIISGIKALATAVLLNLSFILPFLYFSTQDLKCFNLSNASANSVVYLSQMFSLFLSARGGSVSKGTTVAEMSLTVGTALLVGYIVFFIWAGSKSKATDLNQKIHFIGIHCATYALLALFLSSWLMPWGAIILRISLVDKLTASLQFVWRFLGPASLFLTLCASIGLVKIQEERKKLNWITGVVVTLCLISAWSLFDDLREFGGQHNNPMAMEAVLDVDELYLYSNTSGQSYSRETAIPRTANGTSVVFSNYHKNGTNITTDVTSLSTNEDYLVFPLYYYPGYEIRVNDKKVPVNCIDSLVGCELPSAQSHIEIRYTGLLSFKIGDLISLFTSIGILGIIIAKRFKKVYKLSV